MLKTLLSWFHRSEPERPAVTFARQTGNALEWWLIGFGEAGTAAATNLRVLEAAMGLHEEQRSVRFAAVHLANVLVGDLILESPAEVRTEVLAHIGDHDLHEQLKAVMSSIEVTLADMINGFAVGDPRVVAEVRSLAHTGILERIQAPGLSPAAHRLYAAVRHLWERAIVALHLENNNEEMSYQVSCLLDETLYALEGDNRDMRQKRHLCDVLERCLLRKPNETGESHEP